MRQAWIQERWNRLYSAYIQLQRERQAASREAAREAQREWLRRVESYIELHVGPDGVTGSGGIGPDLPGPPGP
jgi:hypothetical protein